VTDDEEDQIEEIRQKMQEESCPWGTMSDMLEDMDTLLRGYDWMKAQELESRTWRSAMQDTQTKLLCDILIELGEPDNPCPSADALDRIKELKDAEQ
jgi:hypothetical protein